MRPRLGTTTSFTKKEKRDDEKIKTTLVGSAVSDIIDRAGDLRGANFGGRADGN